ncbi:3-oxoacyl-[acyl-carrier-protein] synthase 3 [Amycolatopsis sp. NBRC 101858]|uniref:3-oxoacyl-ACP synthase III family protein n=1 Tax=Amycolatopsis sp. NBRC 101858 TaxID=3032200 RepID=UPI0024A22627|nr:3-oxoacyl-[acyl-carrier-protein] synthase III C-terminal domain-containing protein [Amycolatopsis sp. NBRC 101858]GLY43382.1 3-oxoacyl-[acyl-carrier-protein] synthase 3 [Amycolatopsis sp. NBRC 101858]
MSTAWAEPSPGDPGPGTSAGPGIPAGNGLPGLGIVALGQALGTPGDPAGLPGADGAKLRNWGYRRLHRAEPGVGLTDLAVQAGEAALRRAGVAAAEVDLVVLAITDIAEYLYWDPAAAVQHRLGADRAEAVLLTQACGGGVTAFDTVAGRFATHPGYRTALVAAANRIVEPYWDRVETGASLGSDGAAAAVLRRDHPDGRWLVTETISDGRYAGFMRMEAGGAAAPFTGTDPVGLAPMAERMDRFFDGDGRAALAFADALGARTREVLQRACDRAGIPVGALERVLYLHDTLPAFEALAKELGVPLDRTNFEQALAHGHCGPADQLISLERLLSGGELVPGDVVALLSTGSGMHWACTLLRI